MLDQNSARNAFSEFLEKILGLDPFLKPNDHEKLLNEYFHEFQTSLGIKNHLDVANLFTALVNYSSPIPTLITNSKLPNAINLTTLKNGDIAKGYPGWINDIHSITDKIVDPKTREVALMPLLMHNFSKDFDFSSQMTELVDGLRCSDDSKLQLDPESLTKISLEIVEYFQRFEAPYQSASSRQMNLRQMFGILQTFEGFQKFGFAVKAPTKRNSCNQSEFANSANQFLRIGYNPSLDPTSILGMWLNGEIDLSSYGIQQPETIEHEAFHMYLHILMI